MFVYKSLCNSYNNLSKIDAFIIYILSEVY